MNIKKRPTYKKFILVVTIVMLLVLVIGYVFVYQQKITKLTDITFKDFKKSTFENDKKPQTGFDKKRYSTSDPSSIWVVVNKPNPLSPVDYIPKDLQFFKGRSISGDMLSDLRAMFDQAGQQSINLRLISGYRSYAYQDKLYKAYVSKDGQAKADTKSARPGHSEHQTGLAVDIGGANGCDLDVCFGSTPEGIWLSKNAEKYGFIVRYTKANQKITGYLAEPWHLRYVGYELANEMKRQGVSTLEEFFSIRGGDYSN